MELSVFLHHVLQAAREQGWTVRRALAYVRDLGISRVEIDADGLPDAEAMRRALDETGLGVSNVCGMFDWRSGPDEQKESRLLRAAETLGSPFVMPIPGFYSQPHAVGSAREAEENARFVQGMARLAAEAEKRGLRAVMEDYDNALSPIATIEGMRRFLDAVPGLAVALDTGNFLFSGEDVLAARQTFAGRIAHVHLKDRLLTRPHGMPEENALRAVTGALLWPCAVGDGDLPIRQVISELKAAGYTGCLTIEHFGVLRWADAIRRSAENVKRMLAESAGRTGDG